MKKSFRKGIASFLIGLTCLGLYGCGPTSQVYLNYDTGITDDLQYNHELYGINGSNDIIGADPGCIYVSEEENAEYGGYYYLYMSGSTSNTIKSLAGDEYKNNDISIMSYQCFRSKDLSNWELAGALQDGYSLAVSEKDWCKGDFWAPEVIHNPQDGKYYMYFNAYSAQDWGVACMSSEEYNYDRGYLGVAVSDSPAGPFRVINDVDTKTGKNMPTINFQAGCNTKYAWSAIDASPFFDDDGTLYLYFVKHLDNNYNDLRGIWGVKMNSMTEPDYSTVSILAKPGKVSATSEPGKIEEITSLGESYYDPSESGVNEAPYMIKHDGKYYLTYASNGLAHVAYSVHQAVSDSPLSGFFKLSVEHGNPVLDGNAHGHMNGTAHHAFVRNGDTLSIVYHRHNTTINYSYGWDRSICSDRVNFVTNSEGVDVLSANGPSVALQWLPEEVSGYQNLAKTAEVTISNGEGTKYLTDNVLPFYTVTKKNVMSADEDVTITLKWNKPVSVSSVMLYNSYDVNGAFSKISELRLKLAEQPKWASKEYDYAVIQNLQFPDRYWDAVSEEYVQCAPAVAEFDALKITELEITVKAEDRLITEDKYGETNTILNLTELVVLGGVDENE